MKKNLIFLLTALFLAVLPAASQNTPISRANYQLPSQFSPSKLQTMVFSTDVDAHWLKNSDRFWYVYETNQGKAYYLVDPAKRSKKLLFDPVKMAADLSRMTGDPFDAQHLPLKNIKFLEGEKSIRFELQSTLVDEDKKDDEEGDMTQKEGKKDAKKKEKPDKKIWFFEYHLDNGKLVMLDDYKKPKERPKWAGISPDGQTVIFVKKDNIFCMDKANYEKALKNEKDSTIVERQISFDGEKDYSYGGDREGDNVEEEKNKDDRKAAWIVWSPDSRMFVMNRSDNRKVKDLWVIKSLSNPRPTLETYKYHMPGEKEAPIHELLVVHLRQDTVSKDTIIKAEASAFPDQAIYALRKPRKQSDRDEDYVASQWLSDSPAKFYITRQSRDQKRIDICRVDPYTGKVTTLIEERLNTYAESRPLGLVNNGKELIHWSERDGWGHFYLYDGDGKLKNQITSGPFHCESLKGIDAEKRMIYFTANGLEANENPYYVHLYRIRFDGTGLTLLNPGNFNHSSSLSDSRRFFVDNFSRVNTSPKSELRDYNGNLVMQLEETDLSTLFANRYRFPQPFCVKAADGITDIYGVMYKPFDFDSTRLYPIIAYVYPGPQTEAVNLSFSTRMDRVDRLAQFGFIVITVGNRGGHPGRSKWYHNFGYGNLRNYGLADKKTAIEQLSASYPFIDVNKVGITGHSGGGFMSTAAMLVYPDFFKVAVSNAGNHENNIYNRWWSEQHHGVKEVVDTAGNASFEYKIATNSELAKNLKGHLLLTTGEIDNNVHPANTIRVADALIRANKRFDFFMFPGQRHGYGDMSEYYFWLMSDYFCKHLIGNASEEVDILEMNRDIERK